MKYLKVFMALTYALILYSVCVSAQPLTRDNSSVRSPSINEAMIPISTARFNLEHFNKNLNNPPIPGDYPTYVIIKFKDEYPMRALGKNKTVDELRSNNVRNISPLRGTQKSKELHILPYLNLEVNVTTDVNVSMSLSELASQALPLSVSQELSAIKTRLDSADVVSVSSLFVNHLPMIRQIRNSSGSVSNERLADLENFYRIEIALNQSPVDFIESMRDYDLVENIYLAPIPQNADLPPITPDLQTDQDYLNVAPTGIDAQVAWNTPGGAGSGVTIIDIEAGWTIDHEDLNLPVSTSGIPLTVTDATNHGTAVLGVMMAKNDGSGITGISHNANYGTAAVLRDVATFYNVADAIIDSISVLNPGDIMLIEQHAPDWTPYNTSHDETSCSCNCSQHRYLPMEYFWGVFHAIRYATESGIIVVEAAGNGSQDLDHANFDGYFEHNGNQSGAIMVGANTAGDLIPRCLSNVGTRVDVQAWGSNVATLGYGSGTGLTGGDGRFAETSSDTKQWYTGRFGGTSSATPIVAGAAASLQGIKLERDGTPLSPSAIKTLLVSTGTPQISGLNIGPQPDLNTAVSSLLNQSPQTPSTGNTCTTPETISDECGGNSCVAQFVGYEEVPAPEPQCFLWVFCEETEPAVRSVYENICMAP